MSASSQRTIHVLTGCTAVGKTELALRWAEENGAEIVSCDSLLFYRGMDIGTAKPAKAELARVPHHLIDVCDVTAPMDITQYVSRARRAVEEILARNRAVLVTGGSGFYLKTFFGPVADNVAVSPELRAEVTAQWEREGVKGLVDELRKRNPEGLGGLDLNNARRVTRAVERCRATGKTLAVLAEEFAARPGAFADFTVRLAQLTRAAEELNERIEARVKGMLAGGLVEEVRRLRAAGLEKNPSAAKAIGYREVLAMDAGQLSAVQLEAEIAKNTRGLVRKQRTWFRTQLPAHRHVAATELATVGELFGDSEIAAGNGGPPGE